MLVRMPEEIIMETLAVTHICLFYPLVLVHIIGAIPNHHGTVAEIAVNLVVDQRQLLEFGLDAGDWQ